MVEIAMDGKLGSETADALEVMKVKFVRTSDDVSSEEPKFPIEYAYQQFGDMEQILGYKNLSITLCYSEATMFPYVIIDHTGTTTEPPPDDIVACLSKHLGSDQLNSLTKRQIFDEMLQAQIKFEPYGKEIPSYIRPTSDHRYVLYKLENELEENEKLFLERIQSLLYFYIESIEYTDSDDPRFVYYVLFEAHENADKVGFQYRVAGYWSFYKYYSYPDKFRYRAAHAFVFPQFRKSGIGSKLLHAIHCDLSRTEDCYDSTAETPAPAYRQTRDFTTVQELIEMEEINFDTVQQGFSKEMAELIQKRWKMYRKQARRAHEILQFAVAQSKGQEAQKKLVNSWILRIKKQEERQEKDHRRIQRVFEPEEVEIIVNNAVSSSDDSLAAELVKSVVNEYKAVLERLEKHSDAFLAFMRPKKNNADNSEPEKLTPSENAEISKPEKELACVVAKTMKPEKDGNENGAENSTK